MADYRDQITQLQDEHTKDELVDELAARLSTRATSVNPVTEAMFATIAPAADPIEYARRADGYTDDLRPVAKNATALKMLLHERVGRPCHDRILRLTKGDFAECIVAVDTDECGSEREYGDHRPTTLSKDADRALDTAPDRSATLAPPFEPLVDLAGNARERVADWLDETPARAAGEYAVYTLDCTPATGDEEPRKIRQLRRTVKMNDDAESRPRSMTPREQAARALNDSKRLYYVGSTCKLPRRVHEHVIGTAASGVNFTTTFPPQHLVQVEGCTSQSAARHREGRRARKLTQQDGVFAFSDEL